MTTLTPTVSISELPRFEAFAAVRTLEHAGIRTDLKISDGIWRISVSAADADQAKALI